MLSNKKLKESFPGGDGGGGFDDDDDDDDYEMYCKMIKYYLTLLNEILHFKHAHELSCICNWALVLLWVAFYQKWQNSCSNSKD